MKARGLVKQIGYNLRLYCLRISNSVVILLNGGIKQSQKTQDSPDLMSKFRLANKISKAVTEKILCRELQVGKGRLEGDFELSF